MCGIAGLIAKDNREISLQRLKAMTDQIAHRGPDGEDQWINEEGNVSLGHRRLSIIDLSAAGAQPMHYMDRYVIVFNGEIYNYIELRELCLQKGYNFTSQTDTEVILALYDWKKQECLQYFDGMFAFAIYDMVEKKLFAARDRFGEKPLYYYFEPGKLFAFGSEMKALWSGGFERSINKKMLYNYLAFNYVDNPGDLTETFFENIYRLPHSHYLLLDTQNLEFSVNRYWDIDYRNINRSITIEQAKQQFQELFYTSIKRRLRSDVPLGSSLSGGLDSSAIVSAVDKINEGVTKQNTFSAIFPEFIKDESIYINTLLQQLNATPHFATPDSETMLKELRQCFYFQEEPFGSASILVQYDVMRLSKDNNVKVLLDGQGSDELLAGYHLFYSFFFRELKKRDRKLYHQEKDAYNQLHHDNSINGLYHQDPTYYLKLWGQPFKNSLKKMQWRYKQWTHPYFAPEFYREYSSKQYLSPIPSADLNHALYNSVNWEMTQLLRYSDRNSMAYSREVRLPFLYHELAEFLFSLPAEFKIHDGWTKYIQRISFEKMLPPAITWRKDKIGYEPPQKQWMQRDEIRLIVRDIRKRLVEEKILHPNVLKKPVEGEESNRRSDNSWNQLMIAYLFETPQSNVQAGYSIKKSEFEFESHVKK